MMKTEPALITAGVISALAAAILAVVVAFGVELSDAQTSAILGLVAVAGPFVAGALIRRKVSPAGP